MHIMFADLIFDNPTDLFLLTVFLVCGQRLVKHKTLKLHLARDGECNHLSIKKGKKDEYLITNFIDK